VGKDIAKKKKSPTLRRAKVLIENFFNDLYST
jgi:hypothetical protein